MEDALKREYTLSQNGKMWMLRREPGSRRPLGWPESTPIRLRPPLSKKRKVKRVFSADDYPSTLVSSVKLAMGRHPKAIADYLTGKKRALGPIIGDIMKGNKRDDPAMVASIVNYLINQQKENKMDPIQTETPTLQTVMAELISAMSSLNMPSPDKCKKEDAVHAYDHIKEATEQLNLILEYVESNKVRFERALKDGLMEFAGRPASDEVFDRVSKKVVAILASDILKVEFYR